MANPFEKSTEKNTLLSITLTPEQRAVLEQLRDHLGLKTNSAVALQALAVLYSKHQRQLGKNPAPAEDPAPAA